MDLDDEFYQNHAAYLRSWLGALQDDPSHLFKTASEAEKADTYVLNRYESQTQLQKENNRVVQPSLAEVTNYAAEALSKPMLNDPIHTVKDHQ